MDDVKGRNELDVECHKCHFVICYECMFEYLRFNKAKDALLCPHCRQDMLEDWALYDIPKDGSGESLLSMYLVHKEMEKLMALFDLLDSSDEDTDSDYYDEEQMKRHRHYEFR